MQISPVHWLPSSAGRSVPSGAAMMLPVPSHTLSLQSFGDCALVGVPNDTSFAPHTFALQVRVRHSVSVPAHCVAALHCTQVPTALQNDPPPWLHAVLIGWVGFEQTPVPVSHVPAVWHWSLAGQGSVAVS